MVTKFNSFLSGGGQIKYLLLFLLFAFSTNAYSQTCVQSFLNVKEVGCSPDSDNFEVLFEISPTGFIATKQCESVNFNVTIASSCPSFTHILDLDRNNPSRTLSIPKSAMGDFVISMYIQCGSYTIITCPQEPIFFDCTGDPCELLAFSSDVDACMAQFISPDDYCSTVGGIATNISWDFGDGSNISGIPGQPIPNGIVGTNGTYNAPNHTYDANGTYDVVLTIVFEFPNGDTREFSCSKEIEITDCVALCPDPCDFTATPVVECNRLYIDLQACDLGSNDVYVWYAGTHNLDPNGIPNYGFQPVARAEYWDINTYWHPKVTVKLQVNGNDCPEKEIFFNHNGIFMGKPCDSRRSINEFHPKVIDRQNPSVHFGQDFYIGGVVLMNANFEFDNSRVFMGENAGFDVASATLKAQNNTEISAGSCGGLWRGINVYNGGRFLVNEKDQEGVTISDAMFAVRPINAPIGDPTSNLPKIALNKLDFNQNYIGLRLTDGPYLWNSNGFTTGFDDVTFTGGALKSVHAGTLGNLCPIDFDINEFPANPIFRITFKSYAGVVVDGFRSGANGAGQTLNGANFITPAEGGSITYKNLGIGVFADDANVEIHKSYFFDMLNLPSIPNNPTGTNEHVGIRYFDGQGANRLVVKGFGQDVLNFSNMRSGITVNTEGGDNTEVEITNNSMDLVQFGISVVNDGGGNTSVVDILQNRVIHNFNHDGPQGVIATSSDGIALWDFRQAHTLANINDNIVTTDFVSNLNRMAPMSIRYFGGWGVDNDGTVQINHNLSNLKDGRFSFSYSNAFKLYSNQNGARISAHNSGAGYKITNSDNIALACNFAEGQAGFDYTANWFPGLDVSQTTNAVYLANSTSRTNVGLAFQGQCQPSNIYENKMNSPMVTGLAYFNATTGNQWNRHNRWNGSFDNLGAYNSNSYGETYKVPMFGNENPFSINPIGWFLVNGTPSNAEINCTSEFPEPPPTEGLALSSVELGLVRDEELGYPTGLVWEIEKALYEKLEANPTLLSEDVLIETWKQNMDNGTLGQHYWLEKSTFDLEKRSVGEQSILDLIDQDIAQFDLGLEALVLAMASSTTDENVQKSYSEKLQERAVVVLSKNAQLDLIEVNKKANAVQLLQLNESIETETPMAENDVFVQNVYLKNIVLGEPISTPNLIEVLQLASSCPEYAGGAVYKAQYLFALLANGQHVDASKDCAEEREGFTSKTVSQSILTVSPNPSSDYVNINHFEDFSIKSAKIYNMLGALVSSQFGNTVTQQISTADLAEGLYRMVIISEDGRMHNTSFIVQHK